MSMTAGSVWMYTTTSKYNQPSFVVWYYRTTNNPYYRNLLYIIVTGFRPLRVFVREKPPSFFTLTRYAKNILRASSPKLYTSYIPGTSYDTKRKVPTVFWLVGQSFWKEIFFSRIDQSYLCSTTWRRVHPVSATQIFSPTFTRRHTTPRDLGYYYYYYLIIMRLIPCVRRAESDYYHTKFFGKKKKKIGRPNRQEISSKINT